MRRSVLLAVVLAGNFLPILLLAHGGGLDELRCHHDRRRGGYHCHSRSPLVGQSFASKAEALRALGLSPDEPPPPVPIPPDPGSIGDRGSTGSWPSPPVARESPSLWTDVGTPLLTGLSGGVGTALVDAFARRRSRRRVRASADQGNRNPGGVLKVVLGTMAGLVLGILLS